MFETLTAQSATESAGTLTLVYVVLLSFVLSMLLAFVYQRTFRGLSYSRSYIQSVILISNCDLDSHSADEADSFYAVNSLYFDTPSFRFLRQRKDGADRRFNVRVRCYGGGNAGGKSQAVYAEIKHKTPTSIKKFRATLTPGEWPDFLTHQRGSQAVGDVDGADRVSRSLFLYVASAYAIEPKIFTSYRRRAFVSHVDDYARVTFDIDLRYRVQNLLRSREPYSLNPGNDCVSYDAPTIFGDEQHDEASVVLELKATIGEVPVWMIDLIRRFQLTRRGFSQ